jgi:hypothetical protein
MSQRKLILPPLIFLFSVCAVAQSAAINQQERLIALEKMWGQAQILRDAAALERLVGPGSSIRNGTAPSAIGQNSSPISAIHFISPSPWAFVTSQSNSMEVRRLW